MRVTDPVIVEAGNEGLKLAYKTMNRARDRQISDLESEFSMISYCCKHCSVV